MREAGIPPNLITTRWLGQDETVDGYIYLNYNNVVNGKWLASGGFRDLGDYTSLLGDKNKLYGSNGSEIWK